MKSSRFLLAVCFSMIAMFAGAQDFQRYVFVKHLDASGKETTTPFTQPLYAKFYGNKMEIKGFGDMLIWTYRGNQSGAKAYYVYQNAGNVGGFNMSRVMSSGWIETQCYLVSNDNRVINYLHFNNAGECTSRDVYKLKNENDTGGLIE